MAIFNNAEIAEYNNIMESEHKRARQGKAPQVSSVIISLQMGVTLPLDDKGMMWFNDEGVRNLLVASAKKLMNDHHPDEFSVGEKAFLFSMLQTAWLYEMATHEDETAEDEGGDYFMNEFNNEMSGDNDSD